MTTETQVQRFELPGLPTDAFFAAVEASTQAWAESGGSDSVASRQQRMAIAQAVWESARQYLQHGPQEPNKHFDTSDLPDHLVNPPVKS